MGKPVNVSRSDIKYLANALRKDRPYTEMSRHLGVCVDTVKRILQREGLKDFDGAKYVVARTSDNYINMWTRSCMKCGDDKPRPKWQYICNKCKELNSQHSGALGEDWLWD